MGVVEWCGSHAFAGGGGAVASVHDNHVSKMVNTMGRSWGVLRVVSGIVLWGVDGGGRLLSLASCAAEKPIDDADEDDEAEHHNKPVDV